MKRMASSGKDRRGQRGPAEKKRWRLTPPSRGHSHRRFALPGSDDPHLVPGFGVRSVVALHGIPRC